MLRGRTTTVLLLVTASLTQAGCRDTPTAPAPTRADPSAETADLVLRLPAGELAPPVFRDVRTVEPPRSSRSGGSRVEEPVDLTETGPPAIMNARTEAGFQTGFAFAFGIHDYVGNVGRVETTARASHEDRFLGAQTAERQDYIPFLVDFGRVKKIWTWAKIFTDQTCGVSVSGSSVHSAWWEFFQGRGASDWGMSTRSTQASDVSQPRCSGGTGGYTQSETESGGLICSYWITYDIDTGEILSADFLGCVHSSDPKI